MKISWEIKFDAAKKTFYFVKDHKDYGYNLRGCLAYNDKRYQTSLKFEDFGVSRMWEETKSIIMVVTGDKYVHDVLSDTLYNRETGLPRFGIPYSLDEILHMQLIKYPRDLEAKLMLITDCNLQCLFYRDLREKYMESRRLGLHRTAENLFHSRLLINLSQRFVTKRTLKFVTKAVNSIYSEVCKRTDCDTSSFSWLISHHYLQLIQAQMLPEELRGYSLQRIDVISKLPKALDC